jgi:hypothetical protein
MAKISSYSQITTPTSSDLLLGTDVSDDNKTKNFPVSDIATIVGYPTVKIVTLNSTEILNLVGGGVTNLYHLLAAPAAGTSYIIDSLITKMTFGTVAYDFSGVINVGFGGVTTYAIENYQIQEEAFNVAAGSYTAQWLPIEWSVGGAFSLKGGVPLNGLQLTMMANSGVTATQGDGSLMVRIDYRVVDTTTLATTI